VQYFVKLRHLSVATMRTVIVRYTTGTIRCLRRNDAFSHQITLTDLDYLCFCTRK
jgi:hypothetical protein